ncbi:recombinase family protein [Vibrio sp. SCSIO 43136]|uniref:recombinase family protein n=1 Tax=Vibrio sp. SCSIO 43136 TaxID=2819101 RepID=UPI0020753340|nr:recombinase family protein [Vibrio sp. SCSIO 43136]USD64509.1 recombinase family protein [Vibrio sp. SCSIO 43136]
MKYSTVRLSDYDSYEECHEAIEAIENDPSNIVGGSKAFYSGYETTLLKGAQDKIKALERRAERFLPDDEDEFDFEEDTAQEITTEPQEATKGQQVGYIRVSTADQNTARQLADVKLDRVFEEKVSAKTVDRPELVACLEYVRSGDTLHIHSLDRVCRSGAGDAVALVEQLTNKGVGVRFHKEGMEFYGDMSAAQRGVLSILASVAQMERELIRERQLEGIAAAKAAGKHIGRPKADARPEDAQRLKADGLSIAAIARDLGVGRATVYRLLERS